MCETTFKVGDRVQLKSSGYRGEIQAVQTQYTIFWDDGGTTQTTNEAGLEYAKLSTEDAWLEASLLIGRRIEQLLGEGSGWYSVPEWKAKQIRHECYQILGGNEIKVTEEVKAKVRSLIERAERQHQRSEVS